MRPDVIKVNDFVLNQNGSKVEKTLIDQVICTFGLLRLLVWIIGLELLGKAIWADAAHF